MDGVVLCLMFCCPRVAGETNVGVLLLQIFFWLAWVWPCMVLCVCSLCVGFGLKLLLDTVWGSCAWKLFGVLLSKCCWELQ